jgi:hypothetical protein
MYNSSTRFTRPSWQHNATFPNAKAPLRKEAEKYFVPSANKPSRPTRVSLSTNSTHTQWNVIRHARRLQQIDLFEDLTKGMVKCGRNRRWTL